MSKKCSFKLVHISSLENSLPGLKINARICFRGLPFQHLFIWLVSFQKRASLHNCLCSFSGHLFGSTSFLSVSQSKHLWCSFRSSAQDNKVNLLIENFYCVLASKLWTIQGRQERVFVNFAVQNFQRVSYWWVFFSCTSCSLMFWTSISPSYNRIFSGVQHNNFSIQIYQRKNSYRCFCVSLTVNYFPKKVSS